MEARLSGGPLFTLLVDNLEGAVDHAFTVRVVKAVSPALENEGYDGAVEVSSPGIERPLTKPEHFRRYVGSEARVRVGQAIEGQRNFAGVIGGVGETGFTLKLKEGGREVEISFSNVNRAHLKEDLYK